MQLPRLKVVLDEDARVEGHPIEGASPMSGNNDRDVDRIATTDARLSGHAVHFVQSTRGRQQAVMDPKVRGA